MSQETPELFTGKQGGRAEFQSWRGTTDRGSQHRTSETVGDKIGSSEKDRVKRCRHSSACGIFASNPRER